MSGPFPGAGKTSGVHAKSGYPCGEGSGLVRTLATVAQTTTVAAPREGAADGAYPLRLTISRQRGANLRGTYPDVVNVTRTARSVFGNPHLYDVPCPLCPGVVHSRAEAGQAYRQVLRDDPALVADARRVLAGRPLACWCAQPEPGRPDTCHAALLIRVAAGEEP